MKTSRDGQLLYFLFLQMYALGIIVLLQHLCKLPLCYSYECLCSINSNVLIQELRNDTRINKR